MGAFGKPSELTRFGVDFHQLVSPMPAHARQKVGAIGRPGKEAAAAAIRDVAGVGVAQGHHAEVFVQLGGEAAGLAALQAHHPKPLVVDAPAFRLFASDPGQAAAIWRDAGRALAAGDGAGDGFSLALQAHPPKAVVGGQKGRVFVAAVADDDAAGVGQPIGRRPAPGRFVVQHPMLASGGIHQVEVESARFKDAVPIHAPKGVGHDDRRRGLALVLAILFGGLGAVCGGLAEAQENPLAVWRPLEPGRAALGELGQGPGFASARRKQMNLRRIAALGDKCELRPIRRPPPLRGAGLVVGPGALLSARRIVHPQLADHAVLGLQLPQRKAHSPIRRVHMGVAGVLQGEQVFRSDRAPLGHAL